MNINLSYKVQIEPNNKQKTLLEKSCGIARFSYNWGLSERINLYKLEKKSLSAFEQQKILCSKKKSEFPWLGDVSKCSPQNALRDLEKAFKKFFKGLKQGKKVGFPKFKSKRKDKQSFRISGSFRITDKSINIPRVGYVRLKEIGYIPTENVKINSMTVSKDVDKWFVSVQVEKEIQQPNNQIYSVLGVDLGIKTLATCSNGEIFQNNKYLNKSKKKLAHAQRNFSRKKYDKQTKKSSKNRNKDKLIVQKIHRKIRNQRKDSIHKMTNIIVKTKPRYIVLENLDVSDMMKNHKLAGAIGDASFYEIKRQLTYKTSWYGGSIIDIDKFFPSSKMCSVCGTIKDNLTLSDRVYVCDCGNNIDRDLNASINLEKYGLNMIQNTDSLSGIKACGESVNLLGTSNLEVVSLKQEDNVKC